MNDNIKKMSEYKEVYVTQLPISLYRAKLEIMTKHPEETVIVVAAKLSIDYNDWIAFIGYPEIREIKEEFQTETMKYFCDTLHTQQQVLDMGDILDERTARLLFPEWSEKRYRV
jgi:hypothetical protein